MSDSQTGSCHPRVTSSRFMSPWGDFKPTGHPRGDFKPFQVDNDPMSGVHNATPSATILLSELLPRARNRFNGNGYRQDFLEVWNYDAGVVNKLLREFASKVPWVRVIEHPEFHTMFMKLKKRSNEDEKTSK
ncbi:hypothetical protein DPMN_183818 [Dreissena polymorpha]|uniref:Uncharacterized protein n=1 Tax=Dreissena polymorpha TaxID=45954 RepID=A0A9D4I7B6_DREPO|nr:hypothetical protein DPMN_183818 [Dreissena polymorpha]